MSEYDEKCTLYVGNLDDRITEKLLFELFLQAGPIKRVKIPSYNGKPKNFGFVTFKHDMSVQYSIKLMDGVRLWNSSIKVDVTQRSRNGEEQSNSIHNSQNNYNQPPNNHYLNNYPRNFSHEEQLIMNEFERGFQGRRFADERRFESRSPRHSESNYRREFDRRSGYSGERSRNEYRRPERHSYRR